MKIVLVTGSAGLIGSESVRFFCECGFIVAGIDNDMRQVFFGEGASTEWNRLALQEAYGEQYIDYDIDIRDVEAVAQLFQNYGSDQKADFFDCIPSPVAPQPTVVR